MEVTQEFDPLHKWLGIPPAEQPPTMYRLLGIGEFESDPEVIHTAADRQTAFLKTVHAGKHSSEAAELMNQIAAARLCLTNPQKRANYDTVLKSAVPAEASEESEEQPEHAEDQADSPGNVFGVFDVLEPIHTSRFGHLYKARHQPSGRLVTLKLLPPSLSEKEELVRRFEREQKITLALSHTNLIKGYGAGKYEGFHYLVTEFVVGTDLATLVKQQGPLPIEQAVAYTLQAARGLTQLHMHGVYHRNIKPQVLFVNMQGQLKITNLIMARLDEFASVEEEQGENLTRQGQALGTPEYMAPEQARDARKVDGRADIYALGCVLHFLLAARPPYGGDSLFKKLSAHQTQPIPQLQTVRPDVPESLAKAFEKMLAKRPEDRIGFMGDVVTLLEERPAAGPLDPLIRWFRSMIGWA